MSFFKKERQEGKKKIIIRSWLDFGTTWRGGAQGKCEGR
jgi:hypothetical protein